MPEARTPADIEADIVRRRADLAAALDEIAVRVHPKTVMGDAKAKAAAALDRTAGRAYVAANRAVTDVRGQFVSEDGTPRLERVVPVALVSVALVGGLFALSARRRRR
ncbi:MULTISPECIES: DUF3618 domain-containing protein [unclassified Streptomyces]|uniref:DUF3618 domain-containing protein n=1 Tax=unclassified Streptomyces TaxID=2593676 RepID=UPI002DDC1759|nr:MULTISPECIES: DUF3618 domain-containing protein [unclassified Streptomyces]WSA94505.1 DUF3618 domain-containing protein [Streptomyces sp. NBC_01795]WSB78924.1 DUF3618 domain-containing protein [Streptomyces sp. NBC_01775]WSS12874.1 DUF3618 domain-containing protein [Streptomyces sp. NBC_01186]WSS41658.1 DUF3618 domain-containing protein [Streptomyces sp. NBC_01187]